jgi:hypothetical protein
MRVKLLKKIRKRFEIYHLPEGKVIDGKHYDYNIFELVDNEDSYMHWHSNSYAQLGFKGEGKKWCDAIFETEKECMDFLKNRILNITKKRYPSLGNKRKNLDRIKVWYTDENINYKK